MEDFIPTARITTLPASESEFWFPAHIETVYRVEDEKGTWGDFPSYPAAKARLKTRKTVEKAMRTRRANAARKAALKARGL